MVNIKKILVVILTSVMLLALTGSSWAAAMRDIKVVCVAPFTGLGSILGEWIKEAIILAVEEINAKGGVKGAKIQLTFYDDAAAPSQAISVVRKAVYDDKADVILGPNMSSCVLAVHKIAQEGKVPMLVGATSPSFRYTNIPNPWLFRLRADDGVKVANLARYAVEKAGLKKMGLIFGSTDYCRMGKEVMVESLKKYGLEPVGAEQIKEGEKDATGQLLKLQRAGLDSLIGLTHEPEAAVVVRQMRMLGINVPIIGFSAWGVPAFTDLAGEAAKGVISVQGFTPEDPSPKVQEFVKKYKARWGRLPSDPGQCYYDGVYIIAHVVEKVGLDREKIREELEKLKDFPGVQGPMTCDEHHNFTNVSLISRFEGDRWTILEILR